MRKVTETTVFAFFNFKETKMGNSKTKVTNRFLENPHDCHWIEYLLHGNKIAEFNGSEVNICDGGYQSVTTKERVNGVLHLSYHCGRFTKEYCFINQKDYVWYFNVRNHPTGEIIKFAKFDDLVNKSTGMIHLSEVLNDDNFWVFN